MSTKSLNGASISAIILSILQNGDSYGYDIISQVRSKSGGQVEWAAGSLYPVMHRMKADGWIEDYWHEPEGERRRRYYKITIAGQKALAIERKKWMTFHNLLSQLWLEADLKPALS
jgi:PadR family transcriptional regulator